MSRRDEIEESSEETFSIVEDKGCGGKCVKIMKDNLFTILTLIGVAVGFGIGFGVGTTNPSQTAIDWISKLIFAFFVLPSPWTLFHGDIWSLIVWCTINQMNGNAILCRNAWYDIHSPASANNLAGYCRQHYYRYVHKVACMLQPIDKKSLEIIGRVCWFSHGKNGSKRKWQNVYSSDRICPWHGHYQWPNWRDRRLYYETG